MVGVVHRDIISGRLLRLSVRLTSGGEVLPEVRRSKDTAVVAALGRQISVTAMATNLTPFHHMSATLCVNGECSRQVIYAPEPLHCSELTASRNCTWSAVPRLYNRTAGELVNVEVTFRDCHFTSGADAAVYGTVQLWLVDSRAHLTLED